MPHQKSESLHLTEDEDQFNRLVEMKKSLDAKSQRATIVWDSSGLDLKECEKRLATSEDRKPNVFKIDPKISFDQLLKKIKNDLNNRYESIGSLISPQKLPPDNASDLRKKWFYALIRALFIVQCKSKNEETRMACENRWSRMNFCDKFAEIATKERLKEQNLGEEEIIKGTTVFAKAVRKIRRASCSREPILLFGESGVGKTFLAKFISSHKTNDIFFDSLEFDKELVEENMAAISQNPSLEIRFLGGEATDVKEMVGPLEMANKGVLFLDEIGETSLSLQGTMLKAIDEKKFPNANGRPITTDFHLVTATNVNLMQDVVEGRFREDLFHRIHWNNITIPPLRDRQEEIIKSVKAQLRNEGYELADNAGPDLHQFVYEYQWIGNYRTLQRFIKKLIENHVARLPHEDVFSLLKAPPEETEPLQNVQPIPATIDNDVLKETIEFFKEEEYKWKELEEERQWNELMKKYGLKEDGLWSHEDRQILDSLYSNVDWEQIDQVTLNIMIRIADYSKILGQKAPVYKLVFDKDEPRPTEAFDRKLKELGFEWVKWDTTEDQKKWPYHLKRIEKSEADNE